MAKLLESYGWQPMPSKNPYMLSFEKVDAKEYTRMNYYFSTGTMTVQNDTIGIVTTRDVGSLETLERILTTIKI